MTGGSITGGGTVGAEAYSVNFIVALKVRDISTTSAVRSGVLSEPIKRFPDSLRGISTRLLVGDLNVTFDVVTSWTLIE